jgi:hypothetical protein
MPYTIYQQPPFHIEREDLDVVLAMIPKAMGHFSSLARDLRVRLGVVT